MFALPFTAITIGIEDDALPENDEVITIELYNPEGGATLPFSSPLEGANQGRVTVLVKANDHVAGMVGMERSSFLVREGKLLIHI